MLHKTDKIYNINNFNLAQLKQKDWDLINDAKLSYSLREKSILYPGFTFSSDEAAKFYDNIVLDFLINDLKCFTTPRGNLSKDNNILFIGQRPGHFGAHLSVSESAWLLGPSSKMLARLCYELKIFPYFTNFYHSYYVNINKDYNNILKELIGIFKLYKQFYNINEFKLVLLGSYDEYNLILKELNKLNDIKIKPIKIWHPAFLLRKYSEETFMEWVTKLRNKL